MHTLYLDTISRYFIQTTCIQTLYPDTVSIHCIQILYPDPVSRHWIQMLYPDTGSRYCIQTLYPDTGSRCYIQTLYPDTVSRPCIQTLDPDAISRHWIQTLYPLPFVTFIICPVAEVDRCPRIFLCPYTGKFLLVFCVQWYRLKFFFPAASPFMRVVGCPLPPGCYHSPSRFAKIMK